MAYSFGGCLLVHSDVRNDLRKKIFAAPLLDMNIHNRNDGVNLLTMLYFLSRAHPKYRVKDPCGIVNELNALTLLSCAGESVLIRGAKDRSITHGELSEAAAIMGCTLTTLEGVGHSISKSYDKVLEGEFE